MSRPRVLASVAALSLASCVAGCGSADNGNGDLGSTRAAVSNPSNQTAYAFFVSKGLTSDQAAGIVGNLDQESNMSPTIAQPGGPGRGIAQWSVGGRWDHDTDDNVAWYAAKEGESVDSLTLQLQFIWYELETFSGYGLASLRAATTVTAATIAFETDFEGCGACDQSNRIAYAEAARAAYGGTATGTGTGTGTGGSGTGTDAGPSSGTGCYSTTLAEEMADNACVETGSDTWDQCDDGTWVDRWNDPTACSGVFPLESGAAGGCYSSTLGKEMPDNACVQSRADSNWYQCSHGSWDDRWTDPAACDGTYPL